MGFRVAFESVIVGLVAQVAVGWISPFTPLLTGFIAGIVDRNEKEGMSVGLFVGFLTAIGFVVRIYIKLAIPYIYPTVSLISRTGIFGVYLVAVIMIVLGAVGGRVGGSIMQRALEDSYRHGKMFGEAERYVNEFDVQLKGKRSRKRRA